LEIIDLEEAISEAKRLAQKKLATGENADEFLSDRGAGEFKINVTAKKSNVYSQFTELHPKQMPVSQL